jgi:hypothetical protein
MKKLHSIGRKDNKKAVALVCALFIITAISVPTCREQERWYISVHFMSEDFSYNEVHYKAGDYISIETHTPIVFDFPETVKILVMTNEGDHEVLTATWEEDPTKPDYYVHRARIKMVAPVDPVTNSGFIETHIGALIIAEYNSSDDTAVDTAYVVSSN